jgi:hypothetical protein
MELPETDGDTAVTTYVRAAAWCKYYTKYSTCYPKCYYDDALYLSTPLRPMETQLLLLRNDE